MSFESLKDNLKNPENPKKGPNSQNFGVYEFGEFRLDAEKRLLFRADVGVPLTPKALDVLLLLVSRRGQLVSKDELLRHVWPDTIVEENNLNVNVSLLRKTLGEKPNDHQFIVTVPGHGYRFVAEVRFASEEVTETPKVSYLNFSQTRSVLHLDKIEPHLVNPNSSPASRSGEESNSDNVVQSLVDKGSQSSAPPTLFEVEEPLKQPAIQSTPEPNPGAKWLSFGWKHLTLLAVAIAIGVASCPPRSAPLPPMRVIPFTSFVGSEFNPSFSPDGQFMAFCWTGEKNDNVDIYIQRIGGTGPPRRLTTDPADDRHPVWSPDGSQIAFSRINSQTDKATYIVPVLTGGPERRVYTSQVKSIWGGQKNMDWSPDGKFIAGPDKLSENGPYVILLISPDTFEYHQLTFPAANSFGDLQPLFSPDGRSLAFIRSSGSDLSTQDIYLVSVTGGEPKRLTFDSQRVNGFTWTPDGREIMFSSNRGGGSTTFWKVSISGGQPEQAPFGDLGASFPTIARTGNLLAFVKNSGDLNIYRRKLSGTQQPDIGVTQFAPSTQVEANPQISPDGKRVAFGSNRSGQHQIWACNEDGSNLLQLTFSDGASGSPRWSPDGTQIVFDSRQQGSSTADIYVISAQGGTPRRLTNVDEYDDHLPSWSSDGQWIYFASKRETGYQVWKVSASGGSPIQITRGGGFLPIGSPDGKTIYYAKSPVAPGIWQVPVQGGDEVPILDSIAGYMGNWALTNDGIYYLNPETKNGVVIDFFSFATKKNTVVGTLGGVNLTWSSLAVSPDRQWVLYTIGEHDGSDIMLVENFQ